MIRAAKVTRKFGRVEAVSGVSFVLDEGGSLALWGSNGAGKTTLIRCLLGVIRFRGRASIGGIDVAKRGRHARSLVGYVPQELAFHDDARMGGAMTFFAALRRVPNSRAAESLARVGLAGHERKRVRDLSGGMKQRLALAVALLSDPPLIVLDEPTSNLDAEGRGEVVETLRALRAGGKTLLFASHRPDEVISLADRVLVMERGAIERDTTPAKLWPTEKPVQVVRLSLSMASEAEAADALREAGHAVHLNGHGLCVAVARDRKAEPIAVLARHRIEVRDIEIMHDVRIPEVKP
ncbi:MAG: ABC transporter ATP-binding protein [Phycisphaerales bacterium]